MRGTTRCHWSIRTAWAVANRGYPLSSRIQGLRSWAMLGWRATLTGVWGHSTEVQRTSIYLLNH